MNVWNLNANVGTPLRTIDVWSTYGTLPRFRLPASASATFPTAKKVFYMPFIVPVPLLALQLYVENGAAVSGNVDVGIYTLDGTRLINSGSTAQSGTSVLQVFNITDTPVFPAAYYFAVTLDNTTGTFRRTQLGIPMAQAVNIMTETTGSFGLPAVATFSTVVDDYIPEWGIDFAGGI